MLWYPALSKCLTEVNAGDWLGTNLKLALLKPSQDNLGKTATHGRVGKDSEA